MHEPSVLTVWCTIFVYHLLPAPRWISDHKRAVCRHVAMCAFSGTSTTTENPSLDTDPLKSFLDLRGIQRVSSTERPVEISNT